jgi:DNA anti-recombination protein RmuC
MDELIKKVMPSLVMAAVISLVTAIWRFESVASEVKDIKEDMEKHYTKKQEFVVVKNDLKHIKEDQKEVKQKVNLILEAVRR